MELSDEFVNTQNDTEKANLESFQDYEHNEYGKDENKKFEKHVRGKDIIQLKSNFIPIGLILLEKLFDQNDVAKNPKVKPVDNVVEEKNIGTEETPRIIKMSKIFPIKEKKNISI